jgi:hypothetical protein
VKSSLPRAERFGTSIRPFDLSLALSATEVLSSNLALGSALSNYLSAPTLTNGMPAEDGWQYKINSSGSMNLVIDDFSIRIGASCPLNESTSIVTFIISGTYNIKFKGEGKSE